MRNKRMLKRVLAVTLSAAMALPAGGVMPGAEALPAQAAETTTTASEDSEVTLPTPVYHFDFEDAHRRMAQQRSKAAVHSMREPRRSSVMV